MPDVTHHRDFINITDFQDPANGNDLTEALEAILYSAFPGLDAIQVFIPEGEYVVTRQLIPARPVTIRGAGMFATILDFASVAGIDSIMVGAISIGALATLQEDDLDDGKVTGANGADFSFIEDLTIRISGTRPGGFDYGLWSAARVFARNLRFDECGAKLEAGTRIAGSGDVEGNANLSELSNCHAIRPTEHGFMFDGDDANACKVFGCNAFVPAVGCFGFYDASFLGNSYVGCHTDGDSTGAAGYKVEYGSGANRSVFAGCYAEPNFTGDAWDVALPALIIAPMGEMPAPSYNTNAVLAGAGGAGFVIADQLSFVADLAGSTLGDASHPGTRLSPGGMLIRGQGDGNFYYLIGQGGGYGLAGGTGASIVKQEAANPGNQYELIHFGDTRNRPAFPRGLVATLPTYANNSAATGGGLTAGEVYQTSTGEVRIVV
ncbi:MAG TPA: hypothetical protein VEC11_03060 [Allosphingosinicella sp.]|nr:hypothetical protein [Allosphingosinicella sp.]